MIYELRSQYIKKRTNKKGFTLIELLVVISIIMLLMAIGINSYINAQKVARDGRRKADLKEIQSALEMYRADNTTGGYPVSATGQKVGIALTLLTANNYINSLPGDPTTGNFYYYQSSVGVSYNLCALAENLNDPDLVTSTCGISPTVLCNSSASCNFGVKSP